MRRIVRSKPLNWHSNFNVFIGWKAWDIHILLRTRMRVKKKDENRKLKKKKKKTKVEELYIKQHELYKERGRPGALYCLTVMWCIYRDKSRKRLAITANLKSLSGSAGRDGRFIDFWVLFPWPVHAHLLGHCGNYFPHLAMNLSDLILIYVYICIFFGSIMNIFRNQYFHQLWIYLGIYYGNR